MTEEVARELDGKAQETWHWKEVDLREWGSARLKEIFKGKILLDTPAEQAEIWKTEMFGEAFATSRKGHTEVTCNLDCRIYWRGKYLFNGGVVGSVCGTIKFPEVVASVAPEEWQMKILADGEDPSAMRMLNPCGSLEQTPLRPLELSEVALRDAVVTNCSETIRGLMATFIQDMKCYASKEPPPSSDKKELEEDAPEEEISQKVKDEVEAKMESLRVEGIPDTFHEAVANMGGNDGPERVELSCSRITDKEVVTICAALKNNSRVTHLNLAFNHITDVGIQSLATSLATGGAKSLTELKLHNNPFGDMGKRMVGGIEMMRKGLKVIITSSI